MRFIVRGPRRRPGLNHLVSFSSASQSCCACSLAKAFPCCRQVVDVSVCRVRIAEGSTGGTKRAASPVPLGLAFDLLSGVEL